MSFVRTSVEQLVFVATVFGFVSCLTIGILLNPRLHDLRGNVKVFYAVVFGSLAVWSYYLIYISGRLNGFGPALLQSAFWVSCISYSSLYIILLERLLPILPHSWTRHRLRRPVLVIAIPFVLTLPQVIGSILVSVSVDLISVSNTTTIGTVFFALFAEIFLTHSFLKALLQHRISAAWLDIAKANKKEWSVVLLTAVLIVVTNILKICEMIFGIKFSSWVSLFHNLSPMFCILLSFYNFIFVTRTVTKQVLATSIQVTANTGSSVPRTAKTATLG